MNVFAPGDAVGDVPAANPQQVIDGPEIVNGGPTSLTAFGFSSEFERQLLLENDPGLDFISLLELDYDDALLALEESHITPTTNMVYDQVDGEVTVGDSTPNMVRDHVVSSEEGEGVVVNETPNVNLVHDQFVSSDEKGKRVLEEFLIPNMIHDHVVSSKGMEMESVEETPTFNIVHDKTVPDEEGEVVTPIIPDMVDDSAFPYEEFEEENHQELPQPPSILFTSDPKPRLRWTYELHQCFVNAVTQLGGPKRACPKDIRDIMKVEGLTLYHVKSHLQKYRQNPQSVSQWCEMAQNVQATLVSQGRQIPSNSFSSSPVSQGRQIPSNSFSSSPVYQGGQIPSNSFSSSPLQKNLSSSYHNVNKGKAKANDPANLYMQMEAATRFQEEQNNYWDLSLQNPYWTFPNQYYGGAAIGSGSYYWQDFNSMGRIPTLYQNLLSPYYTYDPMGAFRARASIPAPVVPHPGASSFPAFSQVPGGGFYQEGFNPVPGKANKKARTEGK